MNSAFLNISIHFTIHLFRPWIPNSARHRRWTPMIQRGRARRTISAGSWFGQWSPDPPSLRPQLSQPPTVGASRGDLRSAEWRVQETLAERVPDRRRVTWKPPVGRTAGSGDPARTSAINPRGKKTCVNRNFAACHGEAPATRRHAACPDLHRPTTGPAWSSTFQKAGLGRAWRSKSSGSRATPITRSPANDWRIRSRHG